MNKILKAANLSEKHQQIYENLLKTGIQSVSKIALKNGLKRGITYKILDDLEKISLVSQDKKRSKVFYYPNSPEILREIVSKKEFELEREKESLKLTLNQYFGLYNTLEGKPSVQFLSGIEGLKYIYDDIIIEKTDLKIMRSVMDDDNPKILKIIEKQISRQIENNIKVKILSPVQKTKESDDARLTTRKILDEREFHLPAQIILYGQGKVAITSFDEYMTSTLIESAPIRESFEQIFEILWRTATLPQYYEVND